MLDVFRDSAFNTVSLTDAINRIPFKPSRIGKMDLFESKGITTVDIAVEEKDKVLSLIPDSARGTPPIAAKPEKRTMRTFRASHLTEVATVMADEVLGKRAFGSEDTTQGVAQVVNDKIASMKQSHEVTLEHHRLGAIKGAVLDADGVTVLRNLFTEFEVTPDIVEFDFTAATPTVKTSCMTVKRAIEENLGGMTYDHIHCFCNSTWFDLLTNEAGVLAAYARWLDGYALREDMRNYFPYAGIVFEEYPGSVGTTAFIPTVATTLPGNAFFFPVGVPGLFKTYFSPADYVEAVNTIGLEYYAKQEVMAMDKGVLIESQSNPLCLCTRPMTLVRGQYV